MNVRREMRQEIIEEDLTYITGRNLDWSSFEGKTILITGANGFLPSYMVETLLYLNGIKEWKKTHVIGLDRAFEKFSTYHARDALELIAQDVCAPLTISRHIDFIIHAASPASPKYFGMDPVGTLSPNILGTSNLMALAMEHVEGFLFFSSSEVYGCVDDSRIPLAENTSGKLDPTDVRSCYAESKRMGETICVSWFHQHGIKAKIVRPFHTYGPGMRLDDGRVFADFVADIVYNRDIVMKSDGSASRAFCYVADAVAGFFTVLLRGECGQAYNVGNDRCEVTILELANTLAGLFPEKGLKVVKQKLPAAPGYLKSKVSRICPDISRIRALGWEPVTGIQKGFIRTIRSFQ
ncbi:GDP-L-fucose synthase [subsurface metagenome]